MTQGIIRYNKAGKPICEICDKAFHRILNHAHQKHGILAIDYKKKFGLDLHKGICSQESHDLSRERVFENYSLCIGENLLGQGKETRFNKGSKGRTKDKISPQTLIRLRQQSFIKKQLP